VSCDLSIGEDKATIPVTDTEFAQSGNPQSFCTGVSVHHPALIQNTGPLIDMSDIRPGTSKCASFVYNSIALLLFVYCQTCGAHHHHHLMILWIVYLDDIFWIRSKI